MINILLITLLTVYTIPTHSAQVRVHCQTVSPSICTSRYRYSITGNKLDTYYCLAHDKNCSLDYDVTFTLSPCTADFKGQQCFTKACFMSVPAQEMCTYDVKCPGTVTSDTYSYVCGQCKNINTDNCGYCFSSLKNSFTELNEQCIGGSCAGLGGQINVHACPSGVDSYNVGCACCMTSNTVLKTCTSGNGILSLPAITNWMQEYGSALDQKNSSTSNTTTNQTTTNTTDSKNDTTSNSTTTPTDSSQNVKIAAKFEKRISYMTMMGVMVLLVLVLVLGLGL